MPFELSSHGGPLTVFALACAFFLIRTLLREPTVRRELRAAALLLLGALAMWGAGLALRALALASLARYAKVGFWLLVTFGALKAGLALVIYGVRTRRGRVTPRIVSDVIAVLLYLTAISVVLKATLKLDLGGLLATSAIISLVLGLALQETLGNLFAGLSLQLDPPFSPGDWISIGERSGEVVQVAWRATRIRTARGELIVIPNSVIAKEQVVNYSRGAPAAGRDLFLELDYDSPPNKVREVLLDALRSCPRVLATPAPIVRLSKWEASGVQYQVRFFARSFGDIDDSTSEVLSLLWYRLRREGISIPFPTQTVLLQQAAAPAREEQLRERALLLERVDFLKVLDRANRERLAELARLERFGSGEVIIRRGEIGETFYLITAGEASVRADGPGSREVARLRQGEFFGEMSLLTGEPRSATVLAAEDAAMLVLDRAAFAEVLGRNAEVAGVLSSVLASRSEERQSRVAGESAKPAAVELASSHILGRLREVFRLR
jgi:small-conductance mechanosensitive channel